MRRQQGSAQGGHKAGGQSIRASPLCDGLKRRDVVRRSTYVYELEKDRPLVNHGHLAKIKNQNASINAIGPLVLFADPLLQDLDIHKSQSERIGRSSRLELRQLVCLDDQPRGLLRQRCPDRVIQRPDDLVRENLIGQTAALRLSKVPYPRYPGIGQDVVCVHIPGDRLENGQRSGACRDDKRHGPTPGAALPVLLLHESPNGQARPARSFCKSMLDERLTPIPSFVMRPPRQGTRRQANVI